MPDAQGFSYAHWTAVNAAGFTLLLVGEDPSNDPASSYFPSKGTISHVEVELNTIAGATKADIAGTWDSAGAFVALPTTNVTIATAPGAAASGALVISADQIQYKQGQGSTKMKFGVWVKLDAGTANARARVYWRR